MNSGRFRVDSDGDTDMTVPQPVYEFITAPKLSSWNQAALVKWSNDREHYMARIAERCAVTGEDPHSIAVSAKSSLSTEILTTVARYGLKKLAADITDADIVAAIEKRCASFKNAHVPDVTLFFKERLNMNMKDDDSDARVLQYFTDFDRLIKENGFTSMLGATGVGFGSMPREVRMKQRCKILIDNIQPEMLKIEIERLVKSECHAAAKDDVELFELIASRSRLQQHYHMLSQEFRQKEPKRDAKKPFDSRKRSDPPRALPAISFVGGAGKNDPPRTGCWVCKGAHWLKDCPVATQLQKDEAQSKMREMRGSRRVNRLKKFSGGDSQLSVRINDLIDVPFCPDSGADSNVVPRHIVNELLDLSSNVILTNLSSPVVVEVADGRQVRCDTEATLDLKISTAAGPVNILAVKCLVLNAQGDEFLLGRVTLKSLGIDVERMFEQLAASPNNEDAPDNLAEEPSLGVDSNTEIENLLGKMVDEAVENGFPAERRGELAALVKEFRDCWRVRIAPDDAARLEPLKVQLKDGATPFRCKPRRYPPLQSQFLREYTQQLEAFGLIRKNNQSRWACAAVPVKKPGSKDEFRITTDYRPLNSMTVPIAGTTPILSVVTSAVKGSFGFASFDMLKGFWQLPLHGESQEIFSFMTEDTIYTPTRVPQGATDSALHFQNQMQFAFEPLLYHSLLVWIDDVIVYAANVTEFLQVLRKFFEILNEFNLKLNAMKSQLFQHQVKWCGKLISGDGVEHDPERISALQELPLPSTAADLQYFLCASNWMRDSIVDYASHAAPLQAKLDLALQGSGRRRTAGLRIPLVWTAEEEKCFNSVLLVIGNSVPLSFPSVEHEICMFTDASDHDWAVVLTQVAEWDSSVPVHEQKHQLLVCKGGVFRNAQLNWSIVEKEAFPIVMACTNLEYLLQRSRGFRLYCDHANLIAIFSPSTEIKKHIRAKLQRWAMRLTGYNYSIVHIPGENNVWADIVSRWGRTPENQSSVKKILHVQTRRAVQASTLRPLEDGEFVWPSLADIEASQRRHVKTLARTHAIKDGVIFVVEKPWIPSADNDLLARLLVVAHCGMQGHRGEHAMVNALRRFDITNVAVVVKEFVRACLLCKHVKGSLVIQRPWGPTLVCKIRNEVLHWDFLFLGDSHGDQRYLLVLKDGLTHYCELFACASPTAAVAAEAMLDWQKRFGSPAIWVSDSGSHFKNELIATLSSRLKAQQQFVPAYSPWINGTVERLNRDVLQVLRALLLEYKLDTKEWFYLLPIVQSSLNHTQLPSLGNKSPVELFTGLPSASALDFVWKPTSKNGVVPINMGKPQIEKWLSSLRKSLADMHQEVICIKERTRLQQQANKKGAVCNFTEGDFVLWSRVDSRLSGNKLMVRWVGPFRVLESLPHSFVIEHLITKSKFDVHGSRLKFYADSSLNANEELIEHISTQGVVLGVAAFKEFRLNCDLRRWELLVSWQGFEAVEDSWESLADLYKDVPTKVIEFAASSTSQEFKKAVHQLSKP
ncbi:hypothetical protein FI667_g6871, partial [Globisporangium splendens]